MSCQIHTSGRSNPKDGPCRDCRRAELDILQRMQRSELDGRASPAFKTWTPGSWENYQSPDRMHPERKHLPYGNKEKASR